MSSRLRQTNEVPVNDLPNAGTYINVSSDGNYTPTAGGGSFSSGFSTSSSGFSWISDQTGNNGRHTKAVGHLKYHHVFRDGPIDLYVPGVVGRSHSGPGGYVWEWGVPGQLITAGTLFDVLQVSYSKSIPALLRKAMSKFYNTNVAEGLLNAVEAPQLRDSLTGLNRYVREQNKYARINDGKLAFGKFLKQIPGQYLGYAFGIAPLISDIITVTKAAKTLRSDLSSYLDDYSKPITATAQCAGIVSMNPSFTRSGYITPGHAVGWWRPNIETFTAVRTVGVRGHRPPTLKSDQAKKLDYMLERFVASGPVSLAWELVPFSFVLDWFVDLSAVINAVDNLLLGSPRGIEDSWSSEKFTCEVGIIHKSENPSSPTWISRTHDGVTVADNSVSYYHREYLDPVITIGASNRFGKRQATLSAALLYQQVANLVKAYKKG